MGNEQTAILAERPSQQEIAMSDMSFREAVKVLRRNAVYMKGSRVDEALAVLSAHADRAGWQPIETAPKDGSMVLLTDGSYVDAGFYHDGSACYGHRGGAGFFAEEDRGSLLTASNFMATHWQPLPLPHGESHD